MDRKRLKESILKISEEIFGELVDILLWEIVFLGASSVNFSRQTWQARVESDKFLEQVNFETIKNAIANARQKGFIKKANHKRVWPEITEEGKRRLKELVPHYDEKRVWDERVYLITYDIPEEKKSSRELLRAFLRRIGCGMVQESVWLTPYNLKEVLEEFIRQRNLVGNILISDIGEDGSVGEEDLKTLIARIYKLNDLNDQYKKFIKKYKDKEKSDKIQMTFEYLSILRKDSQLPFSLLPSDWVGEKAYRLYKNNASLN